MTGPHTGIYCDSDGWMRFFDGTSRQEVLDWFREEGIDPSDSGPCDEIGWNPSPLIILPNHEREQFDGYQY